MKNLLLTIGLLFTLPSLGTENSDNFVHYKNQFLKNKVYKKFPFFEYNTKEGLKVFPEITKMRLLDLCMQGNLSSGGIDVCEQIKTRLSMVNGSSFLERTIEKLTKPFGPEERIAVENMANMIDKNIERSKKQLELDAKDPATKADVIKARVIDTLAYRRYVDGWWSWLNHNPMDSRSFKHSIEFCSSVGNLNKKRLYECSSIREFVKNYVPKFNSEAEQKIALDIVDRLDANIAHSQAREKYFESVKDLYN